jgi:GAF domain-containing protein
MHDLHSVTMACEKAERLIENGAASTEVLTCLVTAAEVVSGAGSVASVLLIDGDGLLRNGASPNLPRDYLEAIDRLKPNPRLGTCAAAAATGAMVTTPSFLADEKWSELRHLPMSIGFSGAWSMPIKSAKDGRVLGTFGTYFRDAREPTDREIAAVKMLTSVAARALENAA